MYLSEENQAILLKELSKQKHKGEKRTFYNKEATVESDRLKDIDTTKTLPIMYNHLNFSMLPPDLWNISITTSNNIIPLQKIFFN